MAISNPYGAVPEAIRGLGATLADVGASGERRAAELARQRLAMKSLELQGNQQAREGELMLAKLKREEWDTAPVTLFDAVKTSTMADDRKEELLAEDGPLYKTYQGVPLGLQIVQRGKLNDSLLRFQEAQSARELADVKNLQDKAEFEATTGLKKQELAETAAYHRTMAAQGAAANRLAREKNFLPEFVKKPKYGLVEEMAEDPLNPDVQVKKMVWKQVGEEIVPYDPRTGKPLYPEDVPAKVPPPDKATVDAVIKQLSAVQPGSPEAEKILSSVTPEMADAVAAALPSGEQPWQGARSMARGDWVSPLHAPTIPNIPDIATLTALSRGNEQYPIQADYSQYAGNDELVSAIRERFPDMDQYEQMDTAARLEQIFGQKGFALNRKGIAAYVRAGRILGKNQGKAAK